MQQACLIQMNGTLRRHVDAYGVQYTIYTIHTRFAPETAHGWMHVVMKILVASAMHDCAERKISKPFCFLCL